MPATLRGMYYQEDREGICELLVWTETSSSGRIYPRCRILNEKPVLPDGEYAVCFAGRVIPTRKFSGCWRLTFLPPDIDLEKAA
ncbi:MAG TPA: hypothetical protein VGL72_11770 [Bryobacteraceae bacterium]